MAGANPTPSPEFFHRLGLGNRSVLRNDGAKYRKIPEGNLFQSSRDLKLGWRFTFQQDNDLKHTANVTPEWFKGKHLNILECLVIFPTIVYRQIISLTIHRITIPVGQKFTYTKLTVPLNSLENFRKLCCGFRSF